LLEDQRVVAHGVPRLYQSEPGISLGILFIMSETLRRQARTIFDAGLEAASPEKLLPAELREVPGGFRFRDEPWLFPLPGEGGRIRVVGAGKAAGSLARALERRLGERAYSGRILVKHGHGVDLKRIAVEEGGHPLPDANGLRATERLLPEVAGSRPEDRVFFLLTGGASALLVAPSEGISLDDKIRTTELLLRSGADIRELNAVRKHLSRVKGGRLAEEMAPASILALVISDVIGDDLSSIGSGPAVGDPTTFADCLRIVARYGLEDELPRSVRQRLEEGAAGIHPETPKPGDASLARARHAILASNRLSLEAARVRAETLGFEAVIFRSDMVGNVHETASELSTKLLEISRIATRPVALLAGGELTLAVKGRGLGGRNQELALVAARGLEGAPGVLLLSAGTDGTDGPTDAAGAFADGTTWERARRAGLDPESMLADNDSYRLFERLGDLLKTGPTGTNVNDLVIALCNLARPE
jgi:hydroxypyruvate reductase